MSDFSKLLGKLQDTANTAKKAAALTHTHTHSSSSSASSKKRKLQEHSETQQAPRRRQLDVHVQPRLRRPHDIHDLKVKVSFLCIGAQKAGTTWLHEMLRRHQDLSLPDQKEVHFFDWHRNKGLKWYSNQWPRSISSLKGEITPCYAVLGSEKISEIKYLFPDVKIIFLARDLLERAWSAMLMELRNAVSGIEVGKFANAKDEPMNRRATQKYLKEADPNQYDDTYFMDRLMHATHRERSDYASAIRNWLKLFPKEQVLILNYEDMSKQPRELLKDVLSFIGAGASSSGEFVDSLADNEVNKRFNVASDPKLRQPTIRPGLREKMEQYLKPFAQDFNKVLSELGYSWRLDDYSNTNTCSQMRVKVVNKG